MVAFPVVVGCWTGTTNGCAPNGSVPSRNNIAESLRLWLWSAVVADIDLDPLSL